MTDTDEKPEAEIHTTPTLPPSLVEIEASLKAAEERVRAAAFAIVYHDLDKIEDVPLTDAAIYVAERIADALPEADVERAHGIAAFVRSAADRNCTNCYGRGVVIAVKAASDVPVACGCVVKRARRAEPVPEPAACIPAKVHKVQSTARELSLKRLALARETLGRVKQAQATACAVLDGRIAAMESDLAWYFAARAELVSSRDLATAGAAEYERDEESHREQVASLRASASSRVEAVGERLVEGLEGIFATTPRAFSKEQRAAVRDAVEAVFTDLDAAAVARYSEAAYGADARRLRAKAADLTGKIDTLDTAHADATLRLATLKSERARVARHYQPKVERAAKVVRRLEYVLGVGEGVVHGEEIKS